MIAQTAFSDIVRVTSFPFSILLCPMLQLACFKIKKFKIPDQVLTALLLSDAQPQPRKKLKIKPNKKQMEKK